MRLARTVEHSIGGTWGQEPDGEHDLRVARVADFDYANLRVAQKVPTVRAVSASERSARLLKKGDILLEKSGGGLATNVGRAVLWGGDQEAVCSNFVQLLRPGRDYDPRFLVYLHRALYAEGAAAACTKQTTGIQNLDVGAYLATAVRVPKRAEQKSLADFLDRECERIASATLKLEAMDKSSRDLANAGVDHEIDLLHHKTALVPLRRHVELTGGFAFDSASFVHDVGDGVRLIRGTNVGVGELRATDTVYWPHHRVGEVSRFSLRKGDLLVGLNRPWINGGLRMAVVGPSDLPALLLQRVGCLRPLPGSMLDFGYLRLLLRSSRFRREVGDASAVTFPMLEPRRLADWRVPVPSLERQRALAAAQAEADDLTGRLSAATASLVARFAEYRDALITEAVTGQLDVTKVSEAQMDERLEAATGSPASE